MKILQINSTANLGSTGRIAEQIGEMVIKEGWQSIIAYGRAYNKSKSLLYKIGTNLDINIHGLQSLLLGKHGYGFASYRASIDLIKFIEIEKPSIVHIHNLHGYYINYKILFDALIKLQIKIIWTFHDCWPITGHCTYFSDINCQKWKTKCRDCPKITNYPKSLIFDNSSFDFEIKKAIFGCYPISIVTVSKWLKGLVQESYLKNQKVISISNGVDSSKFKIKPKNCVLADKYNINGKNVLVAASTSWAKQKGFEDYLKLASLLNEDVIIILIGLPLNLQKKLPQNIIGINRTESIDELVDWYNIADIVLNLSIQESFGLTSVEGFMCGKPTIVYNATASPELIVDSVMGEIINIGDLFGVNNAIKNLLKVKDNSENIRQLAIDNYDSIKQNKKYIDLYKEILSYK
jgi:putative colanic acid biosynthesis glycosyltransferase